MEFYKLDILSRSSRIHCWKREEKRPNSKELLLIRPEKFAVGVKMNSDSKRAPVC